MIPSTVGLSSALTATLSSQHPAAVTMAEPVFEAIELGLVDPRLRQHAAKTFAHGLRIVGMQELERRCGLTTRATV